ncbi:Ig-like domain-containing protein, partial [Paenibacillus terreus]
MPLRINKLVLVLFLLLVYAWSTSSIPAKAAGPIAAVSGSVEDQQGLKDPYVTPNGPVKEQKFVIPVEGAKNANPGVYWVQRDDGKWTATSYRASGGKEIVENVGTDSEPWPAVGEVEDKIDMNKTVYQPDYYQGKDGTEYSPSKTTNAHIAKTQTTSDQGVFSNITKLEVVDLYFILITSLTGEDGPRVQDGSNPYKSAFNVQQEVDGKPSTRPRGYPKKTAMYYTPVNLTWRGTIVEHKKIQATGAQQMEVGEEDQFKGEVATQAPGETAYGDWVDVTKHSEQTKWSSDNKGVSTVDPETGLVKAVSPGVAKITVQWKNGTYWLTDSVVVSVGSGGDLPPGPTVVCTPPQSAGTQTGKDMSAQPSGI